MKARRRTFQPRIRGGRLPMPGAVEQQIWDRVDADARRFNVSRAFIVSVALAEHLGITIATWDDLREGGRRLSRAS